ncbi:MAG: MFS transporter [Ktedonobacteraceae bacterium]|nr:MFS transporter [Ktedonobacteraceae bacterium]
MSGSSQRTTQHIDGDSLSNRGLLASMLAPLRKRDFCLLVGGQAISTLGDMLYAVALPWFMLTSGQGVPALTAVLTAYGVPRIACFPVGGMLSDRFHPRRVMLFSDVIRALLLVVFTGLVLQGNPALWQLCIIGAFLGSFTGLFLPASFAILPDLLPDQDLQAGNALNFSTIQLAIALGPALAGIIVSRFQPGIAFALDGLSFVLSALTLFMMRRTPLGSTKAAVADQETGDVQAATAIIPDETHQVRQTFWQYVAGTRLLQVALMIIVALNITFGGLTEVALPALARGPFHGGASGFGFMLAAFGFGALLGSVGAGALGHIRHRCITALLLTLAQSIGFAVVPLTGQVTGAAVVLGVAGVANGLTNVLFFTLVQQQVPRYLLGSVMGALLMASLGLYPLSVILGGFVTTHFGPSVMFPLGLLLAPFPILFGLLQRELWEI